MIDPLGSFCPDGSDAALAPIRQTIRDHTLAAEPALLATLTAAIPLDAAGRAEVEADAAALVTRVRDTATPTLMESFLGEYGLSSTEGVALMCLAEALLRVPDPATIEELIEDKIARGRWAEHRGRSSSMLVNTSTWALMLTGAVLSPADETGLVGTLRGVVRRLGEPVVRTAVARAMRELGRQFVLGETIGQALDRARPLEALGYTHSYDMLGEAARTEADARQYHLAYCNAIAAAARAHPAADSLATDSLAADSSPDAICRNPGLSVKLSALHPRYEQPQRRHCLPELIARTRSLALLAKSAGMGLTIDAEEADRLDLSLDVIQGVLTEPALAGWDGFGIVVQAYGRRAAPVLDWIHALAGQTGCRLMVRLVKGAYWDSEIKRAQMLGLDDFPVFTRKAATDVSYIACAATLLRMTDRIYPQFATHNAHTVAAVLRLATDAAVPATAFEFQRLHGMGEALHETVRQQAGTRCRIYAPVGAHRDLLAYLVRRLLENGANSSFVHQIVNPAVAATDIARDPIAAVTALCAGAGAGIANPAIRRPAALFDSPAGTRRNARGWDLTDPAVLDALATARGRFRHHHWRAGPLPADTVLPVNTALPAGPAQPVVNPADPSDIVGTVMTADAAAVDRAVHVAAAGLEDWSGRSAAARAARLETVADLYEQHAPELFALAAREAGKTLPDAVGEVREAVDFLRYYAADIRRIDTRGPGRPRGVIACISPWNFPLAIFTGQIAAALAAGNAVVAKPAEQTPLIAARAVQLMHEAGIPAAALHLLPGDGPTVGGALVSNPRVDGVVFTGSTATAQRIDRAMAASLAPDAPLIAETGGLNAMLVDSTALAEQAVRDILASAFQSAGQRCSALRVLYVQQDVRDRLLDMLFGAMDALTVGDPWDITTDIGPVIDAAAHADITGYCNAAAGRLLKRPALPGDAVASGGQFVAPSVLAVNGIADIDREVFGPVLHVASFAANEIDAVLDAINNRGFGLTFGLHTRMDRRVQHVVDRLRVGNLYVNRNQIGAVVGSQPFGGEGLSGTGPKAGGPHYLPRFRRSESRHATAAGSLSSAGRIADAQIRDMLAGDVLAGDVLAGDARATAASSTPDRRPGVTAAALTVALADLQRRDADAADWRALPDRAERIGRVLLTGRSASSPTIDALDAAAAITLDPVDLPGPTGESNRLRLVPRSPVLCVADTGEAALALAVQVLVPGGSAVMVAPGAAALAVPLAGLGAPVAGLDGWLDLDDPAVVHGFAAVAAQVADDRLAALRRACAAAVPGTGPGAGGRLDDRPIMPLIAERIAPARFLLERHLCVDTTAAGGNASLLAAADG